MPTPSFSSIADHEIARFSAQAEDWWNPFGVFQALHRINPVRLAYIRDQACEHFKRESQSRHSLKGLKILDVGCGGGLVAEPLARMGGEVTAIDASDSAITEARRHAKAMKLNINYHVSSAEELAQTPQRFDIITALEIVEHVGNLDSFLRSLAVLLKPNGFLILSTLNRTVKSFALSIIAAEYLLKWVPYGTHTWDKFVRPSELVQKLDNLGLQASDLTGMVFKPSSGAFELRKGDVAVNYLLSAIKPAHTAKPR